MYKVVTGTWFIDGKRYVRGDMVDLTAEQAVPHGTNLEPVPEPPKPKRAPRKKKVQISED